MPRILVALIFALLVVPLLSGCADPEPANRSPYADHLDGEVRGLSAAEITDLRSGAGMGYALAAEVNGWPGPLHALELADELGLVEHQRRDLGRLREEMLAAAIPLGEAIIEAHLRLEEGFRSGAMDEERLAENVAALEGLYASLRMVHLRTHIEAYPIFTKEQIHEYGRLRGYDDGSHGGHDAGGHGQGHQHQH